MPMAHDKAKEKNQAKEYTKRKLEDLNLIDDFLFQELITREGDGEEFARILLSTILGKPVRKVKIVPQKNVAGTDTDKHGIRMDAYIEDISNGTDTELVDAEVVPDIYDVEPNNKYEKESLPRRMRYYHGLIDTQLLASGIDYNRLQNVIIIIILPYDPFGKTVWSTLFETNVRKIRQSLTTTAPRKYSYILKEKKETLARN